MATKGTRKGITYDTGVIFRLIAELYFSLDELDSSFVGGSPEDDPDLDEFNQEEIDEAIHDSPILEFQEAYWTFWGRLFHEHLQRYETLIVPLCEDAELRKKFEEFCMLEYGFLIPLKQKKEKPHLSVVPTDPKKSDPSPA